MKKYSKKVARTGLTVKLHFLVREIRNEKLDKDLLLIPYLICVCSQSPKLWTQFKNLLEIIETNALEIEMEEKNG